MCQSFMKSSFSGTNGCVEVAFVGQRGARVRDAKNPDGPTLYFNRREWVAFIAGVKAGEFEIP